jgi:2-furoyl-CoA dehydrogenase large subunit
VSLKMDQVDWVGRSVERVEDAALLTGRGRYIDDLGVKPGTLHAAILRSPHAHADILSLNVEAARALPGVVAVLIGSDVADITGTLVSSVRTPIEARAIALERVRYVGEPVAIAVAADRYQAEDALDLIEVEYRQRSAVVDPEAALVAGAPLLHDKVGSNLVSDRLFTYGDPDGAFAAAPHCVSVTTRYPRNTGSPMETYGVVAEYDPHEDAYDVLANFQGPFSVHTVIARALQVSANRLRLRIPQDSGGSFGVKQGIAPYVILVAAAARIVGRPVKWIEDRLEHLTASVSATNRVTTLKAAVAADGRIAALDWDQLEDCGAYLRAPEPATLYRMHGNMTGAYDIRNVRMRNRVVLTNRTPSGLVRGFGGPQVYYPLERLMPRIAVELGLDPLDVIRRNLIPAGAFPYHTATGAIYDSGDYARALDRAVSDGKLDDLKRRREEARSEGRLYGIGYTAAVEPSVSNMGYITTVLTAAERRKAGPKNGAQATATITLDPVGSVTVQVASAPQGQGHRTVLAQVVADVFGLPMKDVRVTTDLDTAKDAWSIASGNYSSRFAPAVAGAAHLAAIKLRDKLARIAAPQLNVRPEDLIFADGKLSAKQNPEVSIPFARVAATGHWSPGLLPDEVNGAIRETVFWTPPELTAPTEADEINSSLCHGFIFDFCGVEVDRITGQVRIDRYVTMHDCGRILHPGMVEGQIRGGFAQAVGAALYEELSYGDDGSFLSGTFADYLLPTATEVPDLAMLHIESPSPFTPLGAKGVGEGNCMSTPVCLANAVADALGVQSIDLPLTPAKLAAVISVDEPAPPEGTTAPAKVAKPGDRTMTGSGEARVQAPPEAVWTMLLDAEVLASLIPGSHGVKKLSETHFQADVTLGVGPVKGRYKADVRLSDLDPPRAATLSGSVTGALGSGGGKGRITLTPDGQGGTIVSYTYEAAVGGKIAAVGGRLLEGASRVIIGQFFAALARKVGGPGSAPGLIAHLLALPGRLLAFLGLRR